MHLIPGASPTSIAMPPETVHEPLGRAEFAEAMAALAPFETRPHLAVALSGGPDSTALLLLADDWVRVRDGALVAFIVDHGLRTESTSEARAVARRCSTWGIASRILTWSGPKPASAIEESARHTRYRLLETACSRDGVLHLFTAHHRQDQQETVALRREAGSGPMGLAGISRCVEGPSLRILRPLLGFHPARLKATLRERGEHWLDDPMNRDSRFARVRLRQQGVPDCGVDISERRTRLERTLARVLPRVSHVDGRGVATLDRPGWLCLPADVRHMVLVRLAMTVGGCAYPPATRKIDRLDRLLRSQTTVAATLGHCRWQGGREVTVRRERRNLPVIEGHGGEGEILWDGRFRVTVPDSPWRIQPAGGSFPVVERLSGEPWPPCATSIRFAPRHPLTAPLFRDGA
ncbi:MAG: tRNA lysidine(34) synthetase TilS [Alphaproteobacteria bacterium]|nr:tRNA lysidine(34) synthetase TilS [Alphaproteobacteria bacterium]